MLLRLGKFNAFLNMFVIRDMIYDFKDMGRVWGIIDFPSGDSDQSFSKYKL